MSKDIKTNSFSVDGLDALFEDLDKLDLWAADDIQTQAMFAAMEIGKQNVLAAVPEASGRLKASVKLRKGKGGKGKKSVLLGVGGQAYSGDEFYGAFLEFGYKRGSRKLGDKRKDIPGEHFTEYSFKEVEDQIFDKYVEELARLTKSELK